MKQRLNITLALALSFMVGTSPLLTFASSRNPARGALPPKRERLLRAPARPKPIHRKPAKVSFQPVGQTTTQLSGGRLLLVGGIGPDGKAAPSTISDPRNGENILLSGEFFSRAWHSTTMLPDGRALIIGGVGEKGRVLQSAGIFDPETRLVLELRAGITPRAYHSATLLTDGSVLIAGGISAKGSRLLKAELWSFKTQTSRTAAGRPSAQRTKSRATLMPDGNVLIESGFDENGNEVGNAELYNSEAESFNFTTITSDREGPQVPFLTGSLPQDRAADVEVDSIIALRFSKPLNVESFQADSLKLTAEGTAISARVHLAEGGRLAFLLPVEPLEKGTVYTVTCSDGMDETNRVTPAVFSFATKGDKKDEISPTQPVSDVDWTPNAENLRGNWRSKAERSSWEDQPSLQARPGETALSGLVLTLRGHPLANVTISIDGRRTSTDHTGRFLLQGISPGHRVMVIDGRSANRPRTTYGTFRAGVQITSDKTNVLPFTIWMPKLDMAHAVEIPSPNQQEIVITNPLIPGLELRLPAGTVIRGLEGEAVTQISITPVPTDRPPFPLPPGINVPVFASIQPGGARVIPPRARLIYPNYTGERPGARINFWNYDPEGKGWYVYGQGTVSSNGKQVTPDPGVVIYEFTGIMIGAGGNPPDDGSEAGDDDEDGDPVDLSTGLFILEKTDLVLPDTIPISLTRTYRPGDGASRAFGIGSSHPFEIFLWSDNNYQEVDLILSDGGRIHYVRTSPGTGFLDAVYEHTTTPSVFYKSRISYNTTLGGWDLRFKDGTVYSFPEFAPLKSIRDRYGNQLTITRAFGAFGNITQITSPNGKWVQFTYDGTRITQAKDHTGRTVGYTYDASGRLWKVTDPAAGVTEYTYDTSHRLLTIKDARGIVYLTNEYNSNGRIITQTQADTSTYEFDYTLDGNGKVTQTDVTDPRGNVRRLTFNSNGYTLTDTGALGTPEEQTITYERQSGTNLVLGVTDPLNRETAYTYDSFANITSITRLAGTQDAVMTSLTYEPIYNQVATITDPLNHTTSYAYDSTGNLTSVTDALSHQTTFAYNVAGQLVSMTDPLSNTIEWAYQSGDLASITNPLGHTTSRYVDGLGRPVRTTDSLGRTTRYEYNALNLPTKVTDSLGGVTTFSYDPNGNLESVTDARTGVTSYTYDDMDRLETRTDPLLQEESYEYDEAGNVVKFTDRRGKLTSFVYDPLNRATFAGFGTVISGTTTYESTVSYTYDAVSRLEEAVDSQSGTITFDYDGLDRLTSETTPQGTVSYAYDDAGRQTSMTVAGRAAVSYTYDNGDRLTGITQGSNSVTYAYDNANRRTSLTLPNGLVTEYGYDVGSNLTSISYKQGTTVLGDLTYEYDAGRNKARMGGSYARTGLPQALSSATYDAANKMTQRASTTLSYDDNGNLTGDGVNTFTWDARNRLTAISGGTSASFQYDSFGRRTSKTVSSQTTNYLYDGADVVQELSGGTPTANMLNGAVVDERHTCDCNGAPRTLLTDALGSTLALTSSTGAVETEYTYDPFGATTTSGTASSNSSQYTGRENDSTGLHYYRARYYSPVLQRFISEDPIGFGGGDINLYAYVGNSPTNFTDPSGNGVIAGLAIICLEGAILGAAGDAIINTLAGRKITVGGLARSAGVGCIASLAGVGFGSAVGVGIRALRRGSNVAKGAGRLPVVPNRPYAPNTPIPKGPHGRPAPESPYPHTQLGTKVSSRTGQPYTQGREFGENGVHIRDIHHTNHGMRSHPNPHQHVINPVTGKRGPPIPF